MANASKKKRRKRRPRSKSNPATAGSGADVPEAPSSSENAGSDTSQAFTPQRERTSKDRRAADDERPPAPWGSFPLVELVVLIGIGMLIAGVIVGLDESRGQALLGTGLVLASLAGLELSIREHFAGFRSHTTLLTATAGVASMLGLYYLVKASATAAMLGGAAVAALAAVLLVRAFRARSGGRSLKLR